MRIRTLGAMLFATFVASTVPSAARADDTANAAAAKELFDHGRDLRARGDCAGALPFFQKAYTTYPAGLGSLRNMAVCQEALSRFASARDSWLELRRAVTGSTDPKYAGWSEDADKSVAKLTPKIPKVTVDLTVVGPGGEPTTADGVDVTIDGQPLPHDRLGTPVDHDPGIFVVRASGTHVDVPDQQTIELAAADAKHLSLRVIVLLPAATTAPVASGLSDDGSPPSDAPHGSGLRTAGWITLGIGAAGVAGAVVSLILRQSALGDLKQSCAQYDSQPCSPSVRTAVLSDISHGKTASTLLTVFGAVGVVGVATGVTLISVSHAHQAETSLVLTPGGLLTRGTF